MLINACCINNRGMPPDRYYGVNGVYIPPTRNPLLNFLYTAPSYQLLIVPLLLLAGASAFLFLVVGPSLVKYLFFSVLFTTLVLSRYLDFWEYGLELYNFFIFSLAFVYGPLVGIAVSLGSFLPIPLLQIKRFGGHHATKTLQGPFIQSVGMIIISLIGGFGGLFAGSFVLANLILVSHTAIILGDYIIGNFLRIKITPLKWDRILVYTMLSGVINYQVFTAFGISFIQFLSAL